MLMEALNLFNSIVILCTGIYGFLYYRKQKRIDNLSKNAKEALNLLTDVEEIMFELNRVSQKTNPQFENRIITEIQDPETQSRCDKIQLEVLVRLNRLKNALLPLRKNSDLVKNHEISIILDSIKKLERILQNLHQNYPPSFLSIDFLVLSGFLEKNDTVSDSLEYLREVLLKIHEIPDMIDLKKKY